MNNSLVASLFASVLALGGYATCLCLPEPGEVAALLEALPVQALPRLAPLDHSLAAEPEPAVAPLRLPMRPRGGGAERAIWTQDAPRLTHLEV